jgi:hypothetical protein
MINREAIIVDQETYDYLQGDSSDRTRHKELYGPIQPGQIVEIPGEEPGLLQVVDGEDFQGLLAQSDEYRKGIGGWGFKALKALLLPVGVGGAFFGAGALSGNGAEAQGFQCSTYYDEEGNPFHAIDRGDSVPAHVRFLACSPDQLPTPVPPAADIPTPVPPVDTPTFEPTPPATATETAVPPTATPTQYRPDSQPIYNFHLYGGQGGQGGSVINSGNASSFSGSRSESEAAAGCAVNGYPTYPYSNACPQPPLHPVNSGTQAQQNYAIASQEQNLRNYNINIINLPGQPSTAPTSRPTATFQPRP